VPDDLRQSLAETRKLLRTFGSAPDPRRRAQEILSKLKRADGLPPAALKEIAVVDAWLANSPSVVALEPRLRALLSRLA
jgi:hypothetical protein